MKYLGYILIAVAFYAGIAPWHTGVVLPLALISTLIYMSGRRAQVRDKKYTGDRNMLIDGAFLLAVQTLIMFTAYILGWFLVNKVSTSI